MQIQKCKLPHFRQIKSFSNEVIFDISNAHKIMQIAENVDYVSVDPWKKIGFYL